MLMRSEKACAVALGDVLERLPEPAREYYSRDRKRIAHDAGLALSVNGRAADVGSGFSPLAATLVALGMHAVMLDRFDYPQDRKHGVDADAVGKALDKLGVERIQTELENGVLPLESSSVESLTCLAVIEHLHHSPMKLLKEFRRVLIPGGRLIVSAPNAVNLRKRISVLLGRTNLPSMRSFCESDRWYGHVHEPTASELHWLLETAGFRDVRVFGKNFVGQQNYGLAARLLGPMLPTGLCSDLYAIGTRPHAGPNSNLKETRFPG